MVGSDVPDRIQVRVEGEATLLAAEVATTRTVGLLSVSAAPALLAGVAGVNRGDSHARQGSFVSCEAEQAGEGPRVQAPPLLLAPLHTVTMLVRSSKTNVAPGSTDWTMRLDSTRSQSRRKRSWRPDALRSRRLADRVCLSPGAHDATGTSGPLLRANDDHQGTRRQKLRRGTQPQGQVQPPLPWVGLAAPGLGRRREAKADPCGPRTPVPSDLTDWPHGLVAGATGAGKSVFVNSVLVSLLRRYGPDRPRLVLIDPKRVEFSLYRDLPHLDRPVVTGTEEAVAALEDAVGDMRRRYATLERAGARKLSEYSVKRPATERLPRLRVVIDEAQARMADKETAAAVVAASKELAATGRAAGVHMLCGTQYPLATVIPSALKASTSTRVALLVSSRVNSQVILDQDGAEVLLGARDMLVCVGGGAEVRRMQSAFVLEEEVRAVVGWWRDHGGREGTADGDDGEASSEDALVSAHIAFVRPGECVAVRRDHVERVLRRMEAESGAVREQWKAAGWVRSDGDNATVVMRTPWLSRARLVVVEWDAVQTRA